MIAVTGQSRVAVCFDLADCLVNGKALPPSFAAAVASVLPGVDYLSVALVDLHLAHLLYYPVIEDGRAVAGPLSATAKCQSGTAAWQAFQSNSAVCGGNRPAGAASYADWVFLPSEVATVMTAPMHTTDGLVGTATIASVKGTVIDANAFSWIAAFLGQCLAHRKCKTDLQTALSQTAAAMPGQSAATSAAGPTAGAQPGTRMFTLPCRQCRFPSTVAISPADLGLEAITPSQDPTQPIEAASAVDGARTQTAAGLQQAGEGTRAGRPPGPREGVPARSRSLRTRHALACALSAGALAASISAVWALPPLLRATTSWLWPATGGCTAADSSLVAATFTFAAGALASAALRLFFCAGHHWPDWLCWQTFLPR